MSETLKERCIQHDHIEFLANVLKFNRELMDLNIKYEEEIKILQSQLQQKENIIKEVRENIKENWQGNYFVRYNDNVYKLCDEILEILDKENK